MSNYRPVSLLISFSKIFETVMQRWILKHLSKYNTLSTEQYGFRVGFRTDNATYKLTTEILNAMNKKLLGGQIFFDLEKALFVSIVTFCYLNWTSMTRIFNCISLIWVTDIVEQQYIVTVRIVIKLQIGIK